VLFQDGLLFRRRQFFILQHGVAVVFSAHGMVFGVFVAIVAEIVTRMTPPVYFSTRRTPVRSRSTRWLILRPSRPGRGGGGCRGGSPRSGRGGPRRRRRRRRCAARGSRATSRGGPRRRSSGGGCGGRTRCRCRCGGCGCRGGRPSGCGGELFSSRCLRFLLSVGELDPAFESLFFTFLKFVSVVFTVVVGLISLLQKRRESFSQFFLFRLLSI